jgi:hypothetical protein
MKKILVMFVGMMLVLVTALHIACADPTNKFEKYDFPLDVHVSVRLLVFDNFWLPFHDSWSIVAQPFLKHIDIISFSVYEDEDDPDNIYAELTVRDFFYSEVRSVYAVYWTYNDIGYFAGTNTHTLGEEVCPTAGYYIEGDTPYSVPIPGAVNEEENTLTWVIPKSIMGTPRAGDQMVELHAGSWLILQKDCQAPLKLHLAHDAAGPLLNTYTLQY